MNRRSLLAHASVAALTGSLARAQPLPVISDTVPPRVGPGPLPTGKPWGASLDLSFMNPGTLDPRITFARASTATYFDGTGTMQTAAASAPRWDYDPSTLALRGLLLEEARTNVLLNSATLGTQSVTVTAQAYMLSFYGTGTITKSGVASGALVGTGAGQRVSQAFTPTAGSLTCTVTGTVTNAQLEAGAFPTSYIPTTGAAATRSQDTCVIQPANMGFFTSPGGSWSAEFNVLYIPAAGNPRVIGRLGQIGAIATLAISSASPTLYQTDNVGLATANVISANAVAKGASTWATGQAKICANGGSVASSATLVTGYSAFATSGIFLMQNAASAADCVSGYIRRVRYWPRILSNTEMQVVTT